jgi:hypothetical protein
MNTLISGFIFSSMIILVSVSQMSMAMENGDVFVFDRVSEDVDHKVKELGGFKMVADQLKTSFHVNDEMIVSLRERQVTYGEMLPVLALAEQMPGGINQDNIDEIVAIRKGRWGQEDWDKVAGFLGIELTPALKRVRDLGVSLGIPQDVLTVL